RAGGVPPPRVFVEQAAVFRPPGGRVRVCVRDQGPPADRVRPRATRPAVRLPPRRVDRPRECGAPCGRASVAGCPLDGGRTRYGRGHGTEAVLERGPRTPGRYFLPACGR